MIFHSHDIDKRRNQDRQCVCRHSLRPIPFFVKFRAILSIPIVRAVANAAEQHCHQAGQHYQCRSWFSRATKQRLFLRMSNVRNIGPRYHHCKWLSKQTAKGMSTVLWKVAEKQNRIQVEITCIVLSNQRLPVFESLPPPCIISWAILVSSYLRQCATGEWETEKSQITMQSFWVIQITYIDILPASQHDVHSRLLRQSLGH